MADRGPGVRAADRLGQSPKVICSRSAPISARNVLEREIRRATSKEPTTAHRSGHSTRDQRVADTASRQLITQRSLVQIQPPQPTATGRYGSGRSALRVSGCGWVADGSVRSVVQPVHGLPVRTRHEMPIGVYRELDRGVSELVPHIGKDLAVLDKQVRESVAQVVEADAT